ncbi:alpha/beta hydrolase [Actinopolymorpha cephalotaxi]|uniref:Acetyl esterase/lipase n=2 Tax=Actinopolymorpha cephalotaxi TaxID=504797 RepID=A0ABX2S7Q5_9ACTN|nr:alpha/beta hydrolase [Actinopolymorpha cephalotaxi]NYH84256.1 acetyl esterase/lipase [Actinopolymorpha cephalotaxi]
MLMTMPDTPYAIELRSPVRYGMVPGLPVWQGALHLDLLMPTPRPSTRAPTVVYLHGGGWRDGYRSHGLYPWHSPLLAVHGFVVANVSYRLSGQAPFPAQIHDVKVAVRWLRANASDYGIDPDRVGIWGDSAGGQLAALAATTAEREDLEGNCGSPGWPSAVQAAVVRCAPSDFLTLPQEDWQDEVLDPFFGGPLAKTADLRRLASPAAQVRKGVPPFLVVHGTDDETVPFDQAESLVRALRAQEGEVEFHAMEGVHHNLHADVDLPWGSEPWAELGMQALDFFDRTLKR